MPDDPLVQALNRAPDRADLAEARRAGVAMILDPRDTVLFIQRAVKPGDPWSGHVGFPGGHAHPEESFLDAAVRETREEVGLALDASPLGGLSDVVTPVELPRRVVRPFVFRLPHSLPDPSGLALQEDEVAGIHRVPLGWLLAGENRGQFELEHRGRSFTLPYVDLSGARLWGMTLRIVDELLDRLDGRGVGLARPSG